MFAYLILLTVFLSFLAKAEDANFTMSAWDSQTGLYTIGAWARHLYDGFIPRYDVLNTTKCYCQDEDDMSDPRYGYYYLFSYWNSQLKRSYSASWNYSTAGAGLFQFKRCEYHARSVRGLGQQKFTIVQHFHQWERLLLPA